MSIPGPTVSAARSIVVASPPSLAGASQGSSSRQQLVGKGRAVRQQQRTGPRRASRDPAIQEASLSLPFLLRDRGGSVKEAALADLVGQDWAEEEAHLVIPPSPSLCHGVTSPFFPHLHLARCIRCIYLFIYLLYCLLLFANSLPLSLVCAVSIRKKKTNCFFSFSRLLCPSSGLCYPRDEPSNRRDEPKTTMWAATACDPARLT
jgi:hypothetical protein